MEAISICGLFMGNPADIVKDNTGQELAVGQRRRGSLTANDEKENKTMLGAVEIKPGLYWIGSEDADLRVFDDLFPTEHGTTYNA